MVNYQKERVKLPNVQLIKLKSAAKNKTVLRLTMKSFEDEEIPDEIFVTTRQFVKICNAIVNNTTTYMKLGKAQISKIIQSGGSFGYWLANFGKKAIENIAIFHARDNLPGLLSNLTRSFVGIFSCSKSKTSVFFSSKRYK